MKFLVTGDLVIQQKYPINSIDESIVSLFRESDFNIVNLEAPITESSKKIVKTGPHIKSDKNSTLDVLKVLNVNLVTLANNHILDYGEEGVRDTIANCRTNNISTLGAGDNLREASSIFYLETEEGRIAILNFAENEWASATEDSAGSNGLDPVGNTLQILEAKKNADFVFVIVHGGHEYYNLPSPRIRKLYRFYIDLGVDLVVAHHPHCISGSEIYKGRSIYYSLGNFLFQNESTFKDWYNGAILEVKLEHGTISTEVRFVSMEKQTFAIKLVENSNLRQEFDEFSRIIQNTKLLEKSWEKYIDSKKKTFINYWTPFSNNRYLKKLFLNMGVDGISKKNAILYSNLLRCEAHFDLTKEFFRKRMK